MGGAIRLCVLAGLLACSASAAAAPLAVRAADMSALSLEDCAMACNRFRASPTAQPEDALLILARAGFNTVRLRVWVHPLANHSEGSLPTVVATAARAAAANLSLWIDFHLSDWWADPGHQLKPAAWVQLPLPQLSAAVGAHIAASLAAITAVADVTLVQVGNEISPGMLWPAAGQACGDSGMVVSPCAANWPALGALVAAGIAATRAAAPRARVVLHTDLGNRGASAAADAIEWYSRMGAALPPGVDYDVIGLSYYMEWRALGPGGEGPLAAALRAAFPSRPLLLAETNYVCSGPSAPGPYPPTPLGQHAFWRDTVGNASAAGMLGVAWWGGEYAGSWRALFDAQYTALPVLDRGVWGLSGAAAAAAPRPPPVLPRQGAVATGRYRNLFAEAGYAQAAIDARLAAVTQQLLFGADDQRLLYDDAVGSYVFSADSNDVRTEGQSYGMMWAVQLNNQTMFDRLFAWFSAHMQHNTDPTDPRYGYSSWHCQTSGASMDSNPASDGETFIATALLFAARRWGDASGRFNYTREFSFILTAMLSKEAPPCPLDGCQSVTNMFGGFAGDGVPPLVRFVPYASASTFTDASYMVPAFHKAWASADAAHAPFWSNVTQATRAFFKLAAHPQTGLMPDYSDWAGAGTNGHTDFSFDAWRAARNTATDYAWFAEDDWQVAESNRLLTFFRGTPRWPLYQNQWSLDGTPTGSGDHSPGLVAMNAVAALACNLSLAWDFVDQLWGSAIPAGQYRYYDGVLFLEAHLALSGQYRSW